MNDKKKFYEMTKPIKFRKSRQAKMFIVLWCGAQRERIVYSINDVLYKIHILQRYSYRDNVETPYYLEGVGGTQVTSPYFRAIVRMGVTQMTSIHKDYFYRLKKDGTKKITYVVKDEEEYTLFFNSCLEDVQLKIANRWYSANNMPTIKVCMDTLGQAVHSSEGMYVTAEYDLSPLRRAELRDYLGNMKVEDITEPMCAHYYDRACRKFSEKLNSMSLQDLVLKKM